MKYYRYKYLRTSAETPGSLHLFWEDADSGYIFTHPNPGDFNYSNDEGATWTEMTGVDVGFINYFDIPNQKIYFDDNAAEQYYIDTSNPAGGATLIVDLSDEISDSERFACFVLNDDKYYVICKDENNYDSEDVCIYDCSADPAVFKDLITIANDSWRTNKPVVNGDEAWFIVDDTDANLCGLYRYDLSLNTVVLIKACDAATSVPTTFESSMSYDGIDVFSFLIEYDGDGKLYLCTYSVNADEIVKGAEFNVSIVPERNIDSTMAIPFADDRAFHLTSYFTYNLSKNKSPGTFNMIADLNYCDEVPASAIIAMTSSYTITTNGKLYKLTDVTDELTNATCLHKFQSYSTGFIGSTRTLGSDQVVQFYDDNDLLWFQGKIKKPVNYMNHYSSALEGLGKSDLNTKISVDYSATLTDVHTIAKACIDALPNYSHLWYDASSMPDPSVTLMVKFMNRELKDCLSVLAKAINGIWWVEPSGYTWLLKLSSVSASGLAYTQGSFNWSPPVFWENLQLVNRVQVFGHFGLKSEAAINQVHQQKYGVKNWYGEDEYPSIHDQECLNDFAVALLALGGAANNALRIKTTLLGVNKIELGESISIQDTNTTELADATAYPMLRLTYDCLKNKVEVIASNNVTTSLGRSG